VSLSSLKITSRTLFKVKIQNKIRCAQFGKIKGMTWQKDAFSDDAWRCRVSQMQWRKVYQARGAAMKNARSPITNRRWYSQTSVNCTMHISCNRRPPVLKTKEEKVTVHSTLPHRVTASTNRSSTGAVYWPLLTEYTEFIAYFWHYKLTCPNNLHFQNYIGYSSVEMLTHANRRYYWPVLMSTECDRRNSQRRNLLITCIVRCVDKTCGMTQKSKKQAPRASFLLQWPCDLDLWYLICKMNEDVGVTSSN